MKTVIKGRGITAQSLLVEIHNGVKDIYESDNWKDALTYFSKFWHYSFRNQILISLQCQGASHVAGFHTWKKLGRHVTKGAKGIAILRPNVAVKKETDIKTGIETKNRFLAGFSTCFVFDISQTEGKEVPTYVHKLKGMAPQGLRASLEVFAFIQGVSVNEISLLDNGANGFVRESKKEGMKAEISLRTENEPLQKVKTLIHELGHFLLGHLEKEGANLSRDEKELQAESCAYIVGRVLGVDFSEYSFGYLAHYVQGVEKEEREKTLEKHGAKAAKVAKIILTALDPETSKNFQA